MERSAHSGALTSGEIDGKEDKTYIYRGDKITAPVFTNKSCKAVLRTDGKCIRGKNGNMLVTFDGKRTVVLARQLRKIKPPGNKDRDYSGQCPTLI